jgi:CheY-specific phosphatase CheX
MNIADTDIVQIVSLIWQAVLGMECVPVTDVPEPSKTTMAVCVHVTGSWQGAVVLGCSEDFAANAAAIMFNLPSDDRNSTDMQDAIAELTNMIGGNIKGLLPVTDACQLSLPAVVAGSAYTARVPGSRPLARVALNCEGHILVVNVLEKIAESRAA